MDLLGNNLWYLGRGHFRQAFCINGTLSPDVTLKVMRWTSDKEIFSTNRYEKTRMDALVMERLTSSPRITDMYGYCATSILVESLPGEIWETVVPAPRKITRDDLNDELDVDNKNAMTPTKKIELALEISEALAELHGYREGVISHDDIDFGQFLRTKNGMVKLNDFNRAKPMLWDPIKEQYCKYYNGHIGGKVRQFAQSYSHSYYCSPFTFHSQAINFGVLVIVFMNSCRCDLRKSSLNLQALSMRRLMFIPWETIFMA